MIIAVLIISMRPYYRARVYVHVLHMLCLCELPVCDLARERMLCGCVLLFIILLCGCELNLSALSRKFVGCVIL